MWAHYRPQAHPLVRVIQGVPDAWDPRIADARVPDEICAVAWSPCNRFIAVACEESSEVLVLDPITLEQLYKIFSSEEGITWRNIIFSPDSHLLSGYSYLDNCIISWDLQTGGQISIIETEGSGLCDSMTYSECGTMLGGLFDGINIITYNVLSGACISSNSAQQSVIETIWTHGEYIHFATVEPGSIIIWEVSFTSSGTPMRISSLSAPNDLPKDLMLLPTLSWFAFINQDRIMVYDAQHDKVLLNSEEVEDPGNMSFSTDGNLFICGTKGPEFFVWKLFPDGYSLYQKVVSSGFFSIPLISPNGESIVSFGGVVLQLWYTASFSAGLPNISTEISHDMRADRFLLEFSPNESFVAIAEQLGKTITVLNLKFSNTQLNINADTEICGMKIIGNKIIIVGDGKILAWDLPMGGNVSNAGKSVQNTLQTSFRHSAPIQQLYASISSDLKYIATGSDKSGEDLCIYDLHTGERLVATMSEKWLSGFTSSGNEVWCATMSGQVDKWTIMQKDGSNTIKLKQLWNNKKPKSGFPWHSPCDYQVTNDGWVLGPGGNQLFWLPSHWRPEKKLQKCWSRKFLAVWNKDSVKPVVLKLEV